MRISYDREADAMYIRLLEGEFQCRVVRLSGDVALDFDAGERLVGIEVLGASRHFDSTGTPTIELRGLLPRVIAG